MRRFLFLVLLFSIMQPAQVMANATPNHVFQVTEKSLALLELLNDANFSTSTEPNIDVDAALPRHVLQLSRDVWRKVQLLRFMNGLPTQTLPSVPARAITPSDVKETVDQIYVQLEGVLPAYGVETTPGDVALPSGKSPTDVFANLLRMSAALDSLGVPATVPNDVHQIAETVLQDALRLADLAGVSDATVAAEGVAAAAGQSPLDAYQTTLNLLGDLKELAQTEAAMEIKGGVEVPSVKESVAPSDVIIVLLRARAEVNAMRVGMGDTVPSDNTLYKGGKTPSDVVTTVMRAQAVIQSIFVSRNG